MRRRLTVPGAILLTMLLAASAHAAGPLAVQLGGGASLPTSPSDFKDFWKTGFNLKGAVGINIAPLTGFTILGKVEYHSFPFDWEETGNTYGFPIEGFDGGDLRALLIGADAVFGFGAAVAPVRPYFFGGGGYAKLTTSDLDIPPDPPAEAQIPEELDESEFFLNGGIGLTISAGRAVGVVIEARYVNIFTDGDDIGFVPITAGLSF